MRVALEVRRRVPYDLAAGRQLQHLKAQVPQAEMFHYATELRSITQGRGRFSWKVDHYAEVNLAFGPSWADAKS